MLAATWPTISLSIPSTSIWSAPDDELDARGRLDVDRVAEPELRGRALSALGRGAVADADDLEVLAEPLGHADDHVVDEASGRCRASTF